MKYNFDEIVDRSASHCRKWDRGIIEKQFGPVPDDFIPMWIADMDFKAPQGIIDSLVKTSKGGTFGYTYTYDEFYQAVIAWQKKSHRVDVQKDWITLGYGSVATMYNLVQQFCSADHGVMVLTPCYGPFARCAKDNGAPVVTSTLEIHDDKRYYINWADVETKLREEKPALFFFCNPHNPSGRIWTPEEVEHIAELCLQYDVIMVSDEIHSEHILDNGTNHYSALNLAPKYLNRLIYLISPNKVFNLGGLKTAYSVIPNQDLRERLRDNYRKNSITSPNIFGVNAVVAGYETGADWRGEMVKYVSANYRLAQKMLTDKRLMLMPMESSYLLWLKVSDLGMNGIEFTQKLATATGVILESGIDFVQDGDDFTRINLAMPRAEIKEALTRINQFIERI